MVNILNILAYIALGGGTLLAIIVGTYLNIHAYNKKKAKNVIHIKSVANYKGAVNDTNEVVFIANKFIKHGRQHVQSSFEGNLVLKSHYDYDCV